MEFGPWRCARTKYSMIGMLSTLVRNNEQFRQNLRHIFKVNLLVICSFYLNIASYILGSSNGLAIQYFSTLAYTTTTRTWKEFFSLLLIMLALLHFRTPFCYWWLIMKKCSWKLYHSPNPNPRRVQKCNNAHNVLLANFSFVQIHPNSSSIHHLVL